ncbi:hypothetical protein EU537_02655 [Candidatus Thorarchaeota archaeon]|nr:MAG: hypothetical protein EU537_02655 [Candidatus Thorarchaeota archaeon]
MSGGRTKASKYFKISFLNVFILICGLMSFVTGTAGWLIPIPFLFIAIFMSISNGREKKETVYPGRKKEVRKSVYDLPDKCPHCGGRISMEMVSWAGPMTALCPYCSGTIKSELRDL